MKYNRSFYFGIGLLLIFLIMAVFAPVIAPYDPFAHGTPYLRPSVEHFLGTNDVGQDIFSELIYGARVSLTIGIVSSLVITVIGTGIGLSSACFGGRCDRILMKLTSVRNCPCCLSGCKYLESCNCDLHHGLAVDGADRTCKGTGADGAPLY